MPGDGIKLGVHLQKPIALDAGSQVRNPRREPNGWFWCRNQRGRLVETPEAGSIFGLRGFSFARDIASQT